MTEVYSAIITVIISTIVSLVVTKLTTKSDERKALHDQLDNILNIAIEYPYLEDALFTNNWTKEKLEVQNEDERFKNIRYEYYAIKVFNYIERFGKYHNWMVADIDKEMNVKEWVTVHEKYWDYTSQSEGYCIELHNLIKRYKNK
jgi:hypothetical protein